MYVLQVNHFKGIQDSWERSFFQLWVTPWQLLTTKAGNQETPTISTIRAENVVLSGSVVVSVIVSVTIIMDKTCM